MFVFSYSFKITCIILRQVISLNTMVLLSARFIILISWYPICIPLILLSALMELASTWATILCNRMEIRYPWQTHMRVEGSDTRPLILILDSILVYEFVSISKRVMQCNAEKILTLRILQKDFIFSLFDSSIHVTNLLFKKCVQ